MYAAILSNNQEVTDVILVATIDVFPNLIPANELTAIGDIWNGTNFTKPTQVKTKEQINNEIKNQLALIDMKSIRALRENDSIYIEQYAQEAATLRSQLIP